MKIHAGICSLALLVGLAVGVPAHAAEGDISVGGQLLFTIKSGAAGRSIASRVETVTERLRAIVSDPYLKPRNIRLVPLPDQSVKLMVKNRLLVTVTSEDGRVNQLSAMDQARIWRDELRKTLPLVSVKPPHTN